MTSSNKVKGFAAGLTLSDRPSHAVRLTTWVLNALRTPKVFLPSVCPLPRSLATTYGISFDVSSSPYLDVSVQAVPPMYLFWISVQRTQVWTWVSFLIQKSPDQCLFAAPRSLSQLITSFIGSQCQGIRPAPLFAWPYQTNLFRDWLVSSWFSLANEDYCYPSFWNCNIS